MMEEGMRQRILITMLLLHGCFLSLDRARKDMKEEEGTEKNEFDSLGRVGQG